MRIKRVPKRSRSNPVLKTSAIKVFENEDLVREILLRTPAKAVLRFKCVSKRWYALLSERKFAIEHTTKCTDVLPSGVYFHFATLFSIETAKSIPIDGHSSLPSLIYIYNLSAIDNCNGLILCSTIDEEFYVVCNPTTQSYISLPKVLIKSYNPYVSNLFHCLAFDPKKSNYFKVVILNCERKGNFELITFSSEDNLWKYSPVNDDLCVPTPKMVYLNGGIHWYSLYRTHYILDIDSLTLTSHKMPLYPLIDNQIIRYFGECGGKLCLVLGNLCTYSCIVYEMDNDTHRLILKYAINLTRMICQRVDEGPRFQVLSILKRSSRNDMTLLLATPGKVVLYYPKYETLEVLGEFPPDDFFKIPKYLNKMHDFVIPFTETLAILDLSKS